MNRTRTLHFDGAGIPKQLVVALFVLIGLCLAGCSNQMAIMQENQASLQTLVQQNAQQMSDLVNYMEQSQKALKVTIQDLRDTTRELSDDMTQATVAHTDLEKTVQQTNTVIARRMASIQEDQTAMNTELSSTAEAREKLAASIVNEQDKRLALEVVVQDNETVLLAKISTVQGEQVALQSELKSLKGTVQSAVDDISAVVMAQQTLEETVSTTVARQLAAMQDVQSQQQTQLDDSQERVERMLNGLTGLEANLTELERILKEDISNLSKAVDLTSQRQDEFQNTTSQQGRGQDNLTLKMAEIQTSTHAMINTLKDELQEVRTVVADIQAIEINDREVLSALSSEEATP